MPEGSVSRRYLSPDTMPSPYGYSQVVEARGGRTVFLAGQVPFNANDELVGPGDFPAQVRQAFENVKAGLAAVDMTFANVVKMQFFVTDIANLAKVRDIRDEFIDTTQPPASTSVQVVALFRPDVLFEMDVIAVG
ncbi:MAG: RidA family protein [Thermomicrobiales bacterium]|nr:RidA family protein [Thermomicrobiales bacterium]